MSDPNERLAKAHREQRSDLGSDLFGATISPASTDTGTIRRGAAGMAADGMSGDCSELEALRMEAAALVDHVLRLKSQLEAGRLSLGSHMLGRLEACAAALRSLTTRPRRARPRKEDTERQAAVLLKSGLFDAEYYLRRNPDVAAAGIDPVVHYLQYGAREMRDPGPNFSTQEYVRRYPGAVESGSNPLYHFIVRGYAKGFRASPGNTAARAAVEASLSRGAPRQAADSEATPAGRGRLVVYTALFGGYDDLFVPTPEQAERCDFVLFTDQPEVPAPWRREAVCYATANRFKQNRFYKLLPHRLFPDYEWSLYLDGNVDLRMDPVEFLDRHRHAGQDFFVFRHPRRANILEELAACIEMRKDNAELMVRQVAEYFEAGFRHSFALTENNIMLRRHNDPALVTLSEAWWEQVRSKSQRDQLSLAYVVEKTAYKSIALFEEGRATARYYPGLRLRPHRSQLHTHVVLDGVLF